LVVLLELYGILERRFAFRDGALGTIPLLYTLEVVLGEVEFGVVLGQVTGVAMAKVGRCRQGVGENPM